MAKKKRPESPSIPWQAKPYDDKDEHRLAYLGNDGIIYRSLAGEEALAKYKAELKLWESQVTGNDAKSLFGYDADPSHRRQAVRCTSCKHYTSLSDHKGKCELGKFVAMRLGACNRGIVKDGQ